MRSIFSYDKPMLFEWGAFFISLAFFKLLKKMFKVEFVRMNAHQNEIRRIKKDKDGKIFFMYNGHKRYMDSYWVVYCTNLTTLNKWSTYRKQWNKSLYFNYKKSRVTFKRMLVK